MAVIVLAIATVENRQENRRLNEQYQEVKQWCIHVSAKTGIPLPRSISDQPQEADDDE